jgi:hypothetical protein
MTVPSDFIDPEVIAFSVVRLSPRGGKTAA